ncbi:MAG: glycosyltransferase [Anaerolineales bacterium]|jgi:glycosyltransferase involved in cell wall biosynthesis|nr:glycosyltransferase [Anaerolineales bacterium]
MRIAMMVDLYKPHISGVTNVVALTKKHLESIGHKVYVFTFGSLDYVDDEENIIRSPGLPLLDTGFHLNLSYSRTARNLLQTMDIVHIHHPFISGSLAMRFCRPRGIPIVFTNHTRYDLYAQAYLPMLPGAVSETALDAYLSSFCRSCDLVIAPSKGIQHVLAGYGIVDRVVVVPNGVDIQPYMDCDQPMDRDNFGYDKNDIVLVYVGRIGPEKNLPFLLRAYAGVAQAVEQAKLLIVGEGPERENLEDRLNHMGLNKYVTFTGRIPYEQVPAFLAMADIFVTASASEVHPLSVIEALATGLPVLGIDSPGVGDIIEDGINGQLVSQGDISAYTAKLTRLIVDRELRIHLGAQAKLDSSSYAIDRTVGLLCDNYNEILGRVDKLKQPIHVRIARKFITRKRW